MCFYLYKNIKISRNVIFLFVKREISGLDYHQIVDEMSKISLATFFFSPTLRPVPPTPFNGHV